MSKIKRIFTSTRVIITLIVVLLALVAIHPNPWNKGLAIRSIDKNSSASIAGIASPAANAPPMNREIMLSINNQPMLTVDDYDKFVQTLSYNRTIQVKTNKRAYQLVTQPEVVTTILPENETVIESVVFNESGVLVTKNVSKVVPKTVSTIVGTKDLGLNIYPAPTTNIRKGLDLQGGTRVLLKPEENLTDDKLSMLIDNMKERLNVYGLSDVVVREAGDLSGNKYVLVEIAGANKEEVYDLLSKQGKFEAKISNETVFVGGQDLKYVCRSADCSGIDPNEGCGPLTGGGYTCRFRFSITLSPESANKQADLTDELDVLEDEYLSSNLDLYLDDQMVDTLRIASDLKGKPVTDIAISGSGTGATQQEAINDALKNMKRLQTILITGSLPSKIDIVKTDSISPSLGDRFVKNSLLIAVYAILAVAAVIAIRYRRAAIAIPIVLTMLVEAVVLLGVAALIGWNIDLAAIAGIIVAIGTGVDDQIVITDEILKGESSSVNWRDRIKRAFFIIMAAYFTTVVAMLPLLFAGAGLVKGFALTTIIGVTIGVLIVRPAFAAAVEILIKE